MLLLKILVLYKRIEQGGSVVTHGTRRCQVQSPELTNLAVFFFSGFPIGECRIGISLTFSPNVSLCYRVYVVSRMWHMRWTDHSPQKSPHCPCLYSLFGSNSNLPALRYWLVSNTRVEVQLDKESVKT